MWHEARRSEKKVHDIMDAARKRAERRAVFLAKRRGDPQQQLKITGTRCRMYHDQAMYQATEDQHGLIPWNGRKDNLIDRFDGRALLDFIRESDKSRRHERTEEDEELEELVNFERYRDLIKRRRRGFSDEQGLLDVDQEDDTKSGSGLDRQRAGKGAYSQVGFSYDGGASHPSDDEDDVEDDDGGFQSSSGDSEDEETDCIGRDHGVQRFGWLTHMDKRVKAAERRQKEAAKSDNVMKLSRKERRKASQQEREKEREASRMSGHRFSSSDPYRESDSYSYRKRSRRSRSRSRSPRSRRHGHSDRSRKSDSSRMGKIEYITEFGGDNEGDDAGPVRGYSPPPSPPPCRVDSISRPTPGRILEALHSDPAVSVLGDSERNSKRDHKATPPSSASSAIAKLSKPPVSQKAQQGEKKETPQERLKRIMSKQLNKQIKKDNASEMLKKRELERQRQEKLAEARRFRSRSRSSSRSRSRSRSRSPPRYYDRR